MFVEAGFCDGAKRFWCEIEQIDDAFCFDDAIFFGVEKGDFLGDSVESDGYIERFFIHFFDFCFDIAFEL